jgi:hypothetical protein
VTLSTIDFYISHVGLLPHDDWDLQSNFERVGSEPITNGNISKCASFWRTFVKSKWVMGWIDRGYGLVWVTFPPIAKEMPNSKSALEHHEFVTKAIADMVGAGAASALPTGVIPTVVSPLDVLPNPHSDNLHLIVNMRYANDHLVKRVFKFEGLTDIADMASKGDYSISYDLTSGYYHVALHPDSRRLLVSNGRVHITNTIVYLSDFQQPLGCSPKSFVS